MPNAPVLKQLERLREHHHAVVVALDTILKLFRTDHPRAATDIHAQLADAVALDAQRRHGPAKKKKKKKRTVGRPRQVTNGSGAYVSQAEAKRQKTAAFLSQFDTNEPRPATGRGVAVYMQHGYLRKRAGGYVRTAKPYLANPSPAAE